jgi:hypothetical protein
MAVTFVIGSPQDPASSWRGPRSHVSPRFTEAVGDSTSSLIALGLILFVITFIVLAAASTCCCVGAGSINAMLVTSTAAMIASRRAPPRNAM